MSPLHNPEHPAFNLIGEHPADRVLKAQATSSDVYLQGDPPPTPRQVSAVLHALADHAHNQHMLGPDVASLGQDAGLGGVWQQTSGLGRYFHALGDWIDGRVL